VLSLKGLNAHGPDFSTGAENYIDGDIIPEKIRISDCRFTRPIYTQSFNVIGKVRIEKKIT